MEEHNQLMRTLALENLLCSVPGPAVSRINIDNTQATYTVIAVHMYVHTYAYPTFLHTLGWSYQLFAH